MTMTKQRFAGFTLMELLIVLAIIVALSAFLIPVIFQQRQSMRNRQAAHAIESLKMDLEAYAADNRGLYPTTEQGLMALVFVPNNLGILPGTTPLMPGGQPSIYPGQDPSITGGMEFTGSTGSEAFLNQPGGGFDPATGVPMTNPMQTGGGFDPATGAPMTGPEAFLNQPGGGFDPATGAPMVGGFDPATGAPITDPTGGMGAAYTAWTQPVHNPQLYTQKQRRLNGIDEKRLLDPWGEPYRYDNSVNAYGVNPYTGEPRPAIWSAGADKKDGTDDDVRGWDPAEAQRNLSEQMMRVQQQNPYGNVQSTGPEFLGPGGQYQYDPNNPGGFQQPGQMPYDPNNPGGFQQPGQMPYDPNNPGGFPTGQPTAPFSPAAGVPTGQPTAPFSPAAGVPTGQPTAPFSPAAGVPTGQPTAPFSPAPGVPTGQPTAPFSPAPGAPPNTVPPPPGF